MYQSKHFIILIDKIISKLRNISFSNYLTNCDESFAPIGHCSFGNDTDNKKILNNCVKSKIPYVLSRPYLVR